MKILNTSSSSLYRLDLLNLSDLVPLWYLYHNSYFWFYISVHSMFMLHPNVSTVVLEAFSQNSILQSRSSPNWNTFISNLFWCSNLYPAWSPNRWNNFFFTNKNNENVFFRFYGDARRVVVDTKRQHYAHKKQCFRKNHIRRWGWYRNWFNFILIDGLFYKIISNIPV